jgi:hypothetical protein
MAIVLYAHARAYMSRSHCRVEARPPNSKAKLKADEGDRYQAGNTQEELGDNGLQAGSPLLGNVHSAVTPAKSSR